LDWLQAVLNDAGNDPDIDFVFAQFHHPFHSELWPDGNTAFTGSIISLLEQFSDSFGKPSAHFFGHTHGYSRGESKESAHLIVNVATAGGNIDYWGEFTQIDYPEYIQSNDDYGFVLLNVNSGDDPSFVMRRISLGTPDNPLIHQVTDSVKIRRFNLPPDKPEGVFPAQNDLINPDCLILKGSAYHDPDYDLQGAAQWQIATDSLFTGIVYDQWKQYRDLFNNQDLQAGDDLTDEKINYLDPNSVYYWRVRYRDRSLGWSSWSDGIRFSTSSTSLSANLLMNSDAENGIQQWMVDAGALESDTALQCNGVYPYQGSYYFAVGAICTDNAYGEAHQDVDLTSFSSVIDAGNAGIRFGGYMRDWNYDDIPECRVDLFDVSGVLLVSSE
jgi:hypothetical protein